MVTSVLPETNFSSFFNFSSFVFPSSDVDVRDEIHWSAG